jgi:hypothetical protein
MTLMANYTKVIRGETPDPRPLTALPDQVYRVIGRSDGKSPRPETKGKSNTIFGLVGLEDQLPYHVNLVYGYDSVAYWSVLDKLPPGPVTKLLYVKFDPGWLVASGEISQKSQPRRHKMAPALRTDPNDLFN